MANRTLEIAYSEFDSINDLPSADKELLNEAIRQTQNSYSPYSQFRVGAALQLENGKIVFGSNQENAAYPSGLCAERTALFSAGANYPNEGVKAIAIAASSDVVDVHSPVYPCGSCRQVMAESQQRSKMPLRVIIGNSKGKVLVFESVDSLLPFRFNSLDKN